MLQKSIGLDENGEVTLSCINKAKKISKKTNKKCVNYYDESKSLILIKTVSALIEDITVVNKIDSSRAYYPYLLAFLKELNKCKDKTKWLYFGKGLFHPANLKPLYIEGYVISFYHKKYKCSSFYSLEILGNGYYKKSDAFGSNCIDWINPITAEEVIKDIQKDYMEMFESEEALCYINQSA